VEKKVTFRNSSLVISLCEVDPIYCHLNLESVLRIPAKPRDFSLYQKFRTEYGDPSVLVLIDY